MTDFRVTVLTAVYNGERFLRESIESVLSQTFENFEFILIDDGSTDNTPDILSEYAAKDNRIVLLFKENTGLTDSLNVGLEKARGKWIARLDADDIAMPHRLDRQLTFVKKNPGVLLVGSGCIEIDENGNTIKRHQYPSSHYRFLRSLEHIKGAFPHSSAFFNRDAVQSIGGYRHKLNGGEDCDLWFRLGDTGIIRCLREPLIKLRRHSMSLTAQNTRVLVMVTAATVCHFRRKSGLSDPADLTGIEWQQFLDWIERRMNQEGYFEDALNWQRFRDILYTNGGLHAKFRLLIGFFLKYPYQFLKIIRRKIQGYSIAFQLMEESKIRGWK